MAHDLDVPSNLQPVDDAAIKLWRCYALWAPLVLAAALVIVIIASPISPWIALAVIPLLALALCFAWWYPGAYHRRLRYGVDATGLRVGRGVWWRQVSFLPRVRIQHTDVTQGPLQRHYGLARLKLYTAGSKFNCIQLHGLSHAAATALRDELAPDDTPDGARDAV